MFSARHTPQTEKNNEAEINLAGSGPDDVLADEKPKNENVSAMSEEHKEGQAAATDDEDEETYAEATCNLCFFIFIFILLFTLFFYYWVSGPCGPVNNVIYRGLFTYRPAYTFLQVIYPYLPAGGLFHATLASILSSLWRRP